MCSFGLRRASALVVLLLASALVEAAAPKIALLLPQSGRLAKAGDAIRDGFLAAYYQDGALQSERPSLHFYDSEGGDILTLVQRAHTDGANFIIGPLDRERLETLASTKELPLPVLALNSIDGHAENLFQFALAPEDEIQRLVDWMTAQEIRRPLILSTADESSQRQVKIFQSLWQIIHDSAAPNAALEPTRKGGVTASIRDIVKAGGKHDAYFLATPSLARQVQPALIYYRNTLPVYSLASAWDPTSDVSGQKDLEGVRFCDLPWMLEDELAPEQQALYDAFRRPAAGYDRLYAFGADAWTLTRQWQALQTAQPLQLRSGRVQMAPTRHLRRIPTCAEVRNGNAVPLWSPESDSPAEGSGR